MPLVSPKEAWDKSHSESAGISQFALGLDLTLKAMQMAFNNHDNSLSVPIFLAGLQDVEMGYSITVQSQGGENYTIGPVDEDDKSLIQANNPGDFLANQIVYLRRYLQDNKVNINKV